MRNQQPTQIQKNSSVSILGKSYAPMGMGCWAIGGPFFHDETPLGFGAVDDAESIRTIHAALDHDVQIFDTAAVYGAGHSERVIGKALKGRDALIISKIGIAFDETSKQVSFDAPSPASVMTSIDACLKRLTRDCVDIILLHQNDMTVEAAQPIFHEMEKARQAGKVRAYGWSTDFPQSAVAMKRDDTLPGFIAVEHAMNIFLDVPTIQNTVQQHSLLPLIRSPLAMGVLTGKFARGDKLPQDDHRSINADWRGYFKDGEIQANHAATLDAIRAILMTDGRTLAQGALGWLWARNRHNVPVPGARTEAQMIENAKALTFGPLAETAMKEIEALVQREPEGQPRAR